MDQKFQISFHPFDGGTDKYDHLVKWISAPNSEVLNQWLDDNQLTPLLESGPTVMEDYDDINFEDGLDIFIESNGSVRKSPSIRDEDVPEFWKREIEDARSL